MQKSGYKSIPMRYFMQINIPYGEIKSSKKNLNHKFWTYWIVTAANVSVKYKRYQYHCNSDNFRINRTISGYPSAKVLKIIFFYFFSFFPFFLDKPIMTLFCFGFA